MKRINPDFHPTTEMLQATKDYIIAEAKYKTIQPIINEIQETLLSEIKYCHRETGHVITQPKDAWLMSDSNFDKYYASLYQRYLEFGFNPKYGYCPLLIAEDELRKAGQKLIDTMQPITGLTAMDVMSSNDGKGLKHIKDFIDVTLRLLVPYMLQKRK